MLQLVLEWGVVGLIILIFLALGCLKYIVRNHANIPPILLSGSVAVILNALLGGSYIYPSSEMAIIFLLAYTANNTQIIEYKNNSKIYAVIGLIAICVVIGIIRHDFFHYGVGKIDPNSCKGPRFWLDASRIELSDGLKTDIPIPCQDNIGN